jgi:hypothetical protein
MSRRTGSGRTPRRPPGGVRRRSRGPSAEAELAAIVQSFIGAIEGRIAGLAQTPDPLDAELVASGVLAMWHGNNPLEREARQALGRSVIRRLSAARDPDSLAFLVALAATAAPPLVAEAAAAADRVRTAKVPEPIWSRSIGRPALVDAWISTDEYEDQSLVAATFAYDRRPPHAITAIIDANFHGLFRDMAVIGSPDKVRGEWGEHSGMSIGPLSEQALADLWGRALENYDHTIEPPVTEDGQSLVPLVRSRLRLLPAPREIEMPEVPYEERRALVAAFRVSPAAADLPEVDGAPIADLARWFMDYACDYGAGDPLRWSPLAVELLLTDWLPRKAVMEPAEVEWLPEVLRRFVRHAGHQKGLPDDLVAETLEAVDRFAPDFAAGMADEEAAGPAKQLVLEMRRAGVDVTDEAAVGAFIDDWNARHS